MGITRAQIARQLLAEGGMPMKKIKGQDHMLAYITPNEANKLVRLGGQETMTPEGIPAYPEYDNYGYSSQQDFDQGNYAASSDPTVSGYDNKNLSDEDLKALSYAVKPTPKTLGQKIVDSIKQIGQYTPFGLVKSGLGNLFDRFGTFAQNMRGGLTQKQFDDARRERQRQNRISNIMGRSAPFTLQTLENLAKLGYTGPLDKSLIGTTNVTRSGTSDQNFPDRVEGILSQVPEEYRFTDAMANLNLQRGVPRDQVFSTRTATGNNFNILDFAVPGHSKAMYEGKDSIVSNAPSVKDYHIAANADLSRRISDQLKNIPGVGEAASLGYDVVAPALSYPVSIGYDALQAKQRMEPGSGIKGFYDAFMNESPFSAAAYRAAGVSAPLAERIQGT